MSRSVTQWALRLLHCVLATSVITRASAMSKNKKKNRGARNLFKRSKEHVARVRSHSAHVQKFVS